jgi:hypothetical protein
MKPKTRRSRKTRRRRSIKFNVDPACWGKNKPLEELWRDLSSYLSTIIIYKGSKPYEIVKLKQSDAMTPEHVYSQFRGYESDPSVVAILTAHPDYAKDVYETLLYPKAKDKTVDYVIANHAKFFKRVPEHAQKHMTQHPITKLMIPR